MSLMICFTTSIDPGLKVGVGFLRRRSSMKTFFAMVFTIALTSSTAMADCRWCANCNTWHCDANTGNTVSQPVNQTVNQTVYSPVVQSYQPTVGQQQNITQATYNQPQYVQQQPVARQVSYGQSNYAAEVLRLTNAERARYGLSPLSMSQNMGSQQHAQLMSSRNSMFHGRGYTENVGFGNLSPSQIVNMWMNSPSHRRNILGPYQQLDVGKSGSGWVQRFK